MKIIKTGEVWTVAETTGLDGLTIEEGGSITAIEGKKAVMTVNCAMTDIKPGTYQGSIVINVLDEVKSWCGFENDYRSAVMFGADGIDKSRSVLPALSGATLDGGITGGKITLRGDCLNGISADGGKLKIYGTTFDCVGNGGDDFQLWGSAIAVGGDSVVVANKVDIKTKGVVMTAVAAAGTSQVLVENSTIDCVGTDNADWHAKHPHLSEVPWVLGLRGTLRATNVLEAANVTYYNTTLTCNGWGVLSVDGTKGAVHNMVNVKASIPEGKGYGSGYGAYILGGTTSTFLGCDFDVPDYVFSVGGNENHAIVGSSSQANLKERAENLKLLEAEVGFENIPEKPCVIKTKRFAGMWHHQSTGLFDIRPGTVIEAGDTAFLIKSGERLNQPHILCDSVSLNAPTVLHLMENDDPGMGVRGHDKCWSPNAEFIYEPKEAGDFDLGDPTAEGTVISEYKAMEVKGDFYNSRYKNPQNLSLIFDGCTASGVISAATYKHKDFSYGIAFDGEGSKVLTDKDGKRLVSETVEDILFGKMPVTYTLPVEDGKGGFVYDERGDVLPLAGYGIWNTDAPFLGEVDITPAAPTCGGVIVELKNGSKWTVGGHGWLTGLTVGEGCAVEGRLTINGVETVPAPGVYKGVIEVDKA